MLFAVLTVCFTAAAVAAALALCNRMKGKQTSAPAPDADAVAVVIAGLCTWIRPGAVQRGVRTSVLALGLRSQEFYECPRCPAKVSGPHTSPW